MLNNLKDKMLGMERVDPTVDDVLTEYRERDFKDHGLDVLRTPNYNARVLFFEYGCEFCFEWLEIIDQFNLRLPRSSQRIIKVDVDGGHPAVNRFDVDVAPTLFIDGIKIQGITTRHFGKGFLEGFLENEVMLDAE